jgi:hypothetical protein
MALHSSAFDYVKPTESQLDQMAEVRMHFVEFARYLDGALPDGPDKNCVLRQLRDCAMWSNVTLIRTADGTPRQ